MKELIWHKALRRPYKLKKAVDIGYGPINIVLIHGLGANAEKWSPLINVLEPYKFRIIAYDLLGFGQSPKPSWPNYTTDQHSKAILSRIKRDLPGAKTILIGHSMGCLISAHIAYKNPNLVAKIILYQPPLLIDSSKRIKFHRSMYEYVANKPKFVRQSKLPGEQWLPFEKSLRNTIISQQAINELKNITANTHIVYGRLDFMVSKVNAKQLAGINPKIKLHYVNAKHDVTSRSAKFIKKLTEEV